MQVFLREVIRLLGLDIDDADEAVSGDERHGQLGADVGIGIDVIRRLGDVVHQHGLAVLRHFADDSLPHADAHTLDFRLVADLETHAEVVGAIVDEQDREDAVVDDGAHQRRGALEQGLQVEGGVERVGQADEELRLQRIDLDLR